MSVSGSMRSPTLMRLRVATNCVDELVSDLLDDVDALGRGADLAGVEEARPGGAAHGDVEVGVVEDDERIDAAELEVDALQLLGALRQCACRRPSSR